ncbi:ABC transporter ATP-binding protein [Glycomyces salinus]|uniref:ABC transporter ATP-binding protein n=1 Tax=Glycomyces salinus TaxID=980294 RepID=UPI0018ED0D0B|nr:ATP-binding cassette domain-containing protein [Glycomyces salinus]
MPILEARSLSKRFRRPDKKSGFNGALKHLVQRKYKNFTAVDSIDLEIDAGESVAYVGPNGAGKSTTVKLLTGILKPSEGTVRVMGRDPHTERIANAHDIGVLFGQRTQLWWDLPVEESLKLLKHMYRVPEAEYRLRIERFDELLGLGEFMPALARTLSLGQRMRADLACALIHAPKMVYLDEPTIGLDISVKDRLRAFLRQLVDDGTTLLLTSHDLADIEEVCDRIVILDEGSIAYDGPISELKARYITTKAVHLILDGPADLDALREKFPEYEWAAGQAASEAVATYETVRSTTAEVLGHLTARLAPRDLSLSEPDIEDVIRRLYAGELAK